MKFVAAVVLLIVILLIVLLVMKWVENARKPRVGKWHLSPRTDSTTGDRQIFLVRSGEPDFLFRTVPRDAPDDKWDMAMLDAEIQCREWNRLHKELMA
jgi:hypothetical protein